MPSILQVVRFSRARFAGHSKWHNIRHRKAAQDAKKSKLFSKISREIVAAAKGTAACAPNRPFAHELAFIAGGTDASSNFRLQYALDRAKASSMPKEVVERAIKAAGDRSTGERVNGTSYKF